MDKTLVAYFSATGTTAGVAKKLAEAAGAALYEIKPQELYTAADLNWQDKNSRSSVEMADKSSRPELADKNAPISDYDTLFLGFPIWWHVAPTIINTFWKAMILTVKNRTVCYQRRQRFRQHRQRTGTQCQRRSNYRRQSTE